MRVTFWGARGTFPATGAEYLRYGGDTMCIEVEFDGARIILDAGSGLRALGAKINADRNPSRTHIVLTHLHLDHIMGLPHFAPFWRDDALVMLHAPHDCVSGDPAQTIFSVLKPPLFPIAAGDLPAAIGLREFHLGEEFSPVAGAVVRTIALNHQGACAGLALETPRRKLCYITDHEHGDAEIDADLERFVQGADMLIYDATFTDDEMPTHRNWGHSSWEEGVRLKKRAGAKLLALVHHNPDRTDVALDLFGEAVAAHTSNVFFARSRMSITL